MTNPAVAKWLQEIAAAKARTGDKRATQGPTPSPSLSDPSAENPTSVAPQLSAPAPAPSPKNYGIITSYNLRTRQKQLKLVLPPEPRKPRPGECCGNDCEPCVNTLYYQDLEAHRQTVQEMQQQYEQACRDLENGVEEPTTMSAATVSSDTHEDDKGLSVRAYRPFKILQKERLADNTLLIVCDTPSPSSSIVHNNKLSMFHILIRFQLPKTAGDTIEDQGSSQSQKEQPFVTKAFTPVDLPTSHGKLTFLVKLYPPPHRTSELFRALRVWSPSSSPSTTDQGSGQDGEPGVLYLRGPVRTGFDLDHSPRIPSQRPLWRIGQRGRSKARRRVVMIAAGSGVTPMYQILQQYHAELARRRRHRQDQALEQSAFEKQGERELCAFSASSALGTSGATQQAGDHRVHGEIETFVRVQHILSSIDSTNSTGVSHASDQKDTGRGSEGMHGVVTSGRITPQILQNTLTSRHSAWKAETSCDLAELSLQDEEEGPIQIVICGPEAFNRDVVAMLGQIGYSDEQPGRCTIHVLE